MSSSLITQIDADDRALVGEYLHSRDNALSIKTAEAYEADLAQLAVYLGSSLLDAGPDDISGWVAANRRDPRDPSDPRPWSSSTANRKLSSIREFYRWAVLTGRMVTDPTSQVRGPRFRRSTPPRLSKRHVARIFDYVDSQVTLREGWHSDAHLVDLLILHFMYFLGLRVTEAVTLPLQRVRLETNEFDEPELRAYPIKKGEKEKPYPIIGQVRQTYDRWMLRRAQLQIKPAAKNLLCVHPQHGGPITRRRMWERVNTLAAAAGLPDEVLNIISPHIFRHAFAHHALADGATIAEVQAGLDHEVISSTQVYVAADEAMRLNLLRKTSRY